MKLGNFDFRPTLWPSLAFFLLFPLLVGLGTWQLNRADEKHQLMMDREGRKDDVALDLNRIDSLEASDQHKPAVVKGHYLARPQWLQDNRLYQGRPGYHVFSLFQVDALTDRKVLINRGWISLGQSRSFLPDVPVPEGKHTLQGRLDTPASVGIVLEAVALNDLAPVSVVQHLDLAELSEVLGEHIPAYALVLDGGQPGLLQRDWRPAKLITPEKHIGYAVQWYALAFALTFIYLGVNTHRRKEESLDGS